MEVRAGCRAKTRPGDGAQRAVRKISLHGLIWVSVTVACAVLTLGAGWSVWKARERAYAGAMVTTENLAGVLKQHSERIVDSIDMMLKVVARELGPAATDAARQSATS